MTILLVIIVGTHPLRSIEQQYCAQTTCDQQRAEPQHRVPHLELRQAWRCFNEPKAPAYLGAYGSCLILAMDFHVARKGNDGHQEAQWVLRNLLRNDRI